MKVSIFLYIVLLVVCTRAGSLVVQNATAELLPCDSVPPTLPYPSFCWDEPRLAVRTNRTFVRVDNALVNSSSVSLAIRNASSLMLGPLSAPSGGVPEYVSWIGGDLRLGAYSTLLARAQRIVVGGDFVIGRNASIEFSALDGSGVHVVVHGCLRFEVNMSNSLALSVDAASAANGTDYLLFEMPNGYCVEGGQFGSVGGIYVNASDGTYGSPQAGTECPYSSGLAVLFQMVCTAETVPSPLPSPIFGPAIVIESPTVSPSPAGVPVVTLTFDTPVVTEATTTTTTTTTEITPTPTATTSSLAVVIITPEPATSSVANASTPAETHVVQQATIDWPMLWSIVGVASGIIVVGVAVSLVILFNRNARQNLLPFRDRARSLPSGPSRSDMSLQVGGFEESPHEWRR